MGDHEALAAFLADTRDAATNALGLLDETPPPNGGGNGNGGEEPPPNGRQPIYVWAGIWQLGQDVLDRVQGAVQGFVHMIHEPDGFPGAPTFHPDWVDATAHAVSEGFGVRTGCYVAGQQPSSVAAYLDGTGYASAMDCEPYSGTPHDWWWDMSAAAALYAGDLIGQSIDDALIYTSSGASWHGSYQDLVSYEASGIHYYPDNKFGQFVDGLMGQGVQVNYTDGVFHWGPQAQGYTWETGAAESAARCAARFPGAKASVMLWPDNDEMDEMWPVGAMAEAFEAATRVCTGPVVLYQHRIDDPNAYPWDDLFAELRDLYV